MFISLILHSDIKYNMKSVAGIFSVLFSAAVLVSCSPEIKLQNNLTRDGGRWNIDEFKTTVVVSTTPDVPVITQTFNVGEAIFYESGTGVWIQYDTLTMQNVATYFEWENTSSEVILNLEGETEETTFSVNEVSKDEQWWVRDEEFAVGDVITTTTIEIHLIREQELDNK